MPDVHAGKGCTIGTTMTVIDKAVPNVVGVDIGCRMYTVSLGKIDIDFAQLDEACHFVPSGMNVWQGRRSEIQAALEAIADKKANGPTSIPEDLCYLYGKYFKDYLADVEICQQFAKRNRELIAEVILSRCGLAAVDAFHTIHNYIDTDEMILRKGAIAAHKGEKVLIPINMRDGSVLAVGKGNPEWNYSAPHGAGRVMSRGNARRSLSMDEYRKEMEGIYSTSVNEDTLDEAPMAYKSLKDIIDVIEDSVEVIEVLKPIYNFKASETVKFGKNINSLRKQAGVSVKDLQDIFGFGTPQAIYKWQHGTALPTIDNLVVLAAVLGVKIDDILVMDESSKLWWNEPAYIAEMYLAEIK